MFHISSGEGTPEVVQDSSTFSPSITVTLAGLRVAMGTSTYNQGVGTKRKRMRKTERQGYSDGLREGVGEESKLRIHGRLSSFQLKHKARNNLDNKSGRAGTHTHTHYHRVKRNAHKERPQTQSLANTHTHSNTLAFKHSHSNQTVRQRGRVQTQWWLHWLLVHVFSRASTKLIGQSLKPLSKQRHWWH